MAEDDVGLILISHDLAVVADMADRIAIMKDGEVVEEGETVGLFRGLQPSLFAHAVRGLDLPLASGPRRLHAGRRAPRADPRCQRRRPRLPPAAADAVRKRRAIFRAVDDVGLTIRRGENLGLVGESGSGKSTLARVILALDEAARRRRHPRRQRFPGEPRARRGATSAATSRRSSRTPMAASIRAIAWRG